MPSSIARFCGLFTLLSLERCYFFEDARCTVLALTVKINYKRTYTFYNLYLIYNRQHNQSLKGGVQQLIGSFRQNLIIIRKTVMTKRFRLKLQLHTLSHLSHGARTQLSDVNTHELITNGWGSKCLVWLGHTDLEYSSLGKYILMQR